MLAETVAFAAAFIAIACLLFHIPNRVSRGNVFLLFGVVVVLLGCVLNVPLLLLGILLTLVGLVASRTGATFKAFLSATTLSILVICLGMTLFFTPTLMERARLREKYPIDS